MGDSRVRGFLFTKNNYDEAYIEFLRHIIVPSAKYVVWGKEIAPTTGTPHLQGYVYYKEKKSLESQRLLFACDVRAVGVDNGCAGYCSKDGIVEEHGVPPKTTKEKSAEGGAANKRKWEDAWESAVAGDYDAIPCEIKWKYYETMKKIRRDNVVPPEQLPRCDNLWIYGPRDTGKSYRARQLGKQDFGGTYFVKAADNDWWCGYQGQDTIVIDDFDKYHIKMGYHLKIWADIYPFTAPVKGNSLEIRPKRIIVTSNWSIEEIWADENTRLPLLKRFQVEWRNVVYVPPISKEKGDDEVVS